MGQGAKNQGDDSATTLPEAETGEVEENIADEVPGSEAGEFFISSLREQALDEFSRARKALSGLIGAAEKEKKRIRYESDLVAFARDICGFKDVNPTLHGQVARFLDKNKDAVILLPREHLKSSLVTVSFTVQQIARNPDIRCAIYSITQDLSSQFLHQICNIIRSERFQSMWPLRIERETTDVLIVKRSPSVREPTVIATSVGAAQVGNHYDINIYDDLIDGRIAASTESLERTWRWFTESLALHDKDSRLIYVGTRWHDNDVAGRLMMDRTYKVLVRQAIENGRVIFPERFSLERLQKLRARMPIDLYCSQYLNDPVPAAERRLRSEWLPVVDELPDGYTFLTVDPAISLSHPREKRLDYAVILVTRVTPDGIIVIADIQRGRWNPRDLIDRMLEACSVWQPTRAGIESEAHSKILSFFLREEVLSRNNFFRFQELKTRCLPKEGRIMRIEPYLRSGRIKIYSGCPFQYELKSEMDRFPHAKTDDILDALAYQFDIIHYPASPEEKEEPIYEPAEMFARWSEKVLAEAWQPSDAAPVLGSRSVRSAVLRGVI